MKDEERQRLALLSAWAMVLASQAQILRKDEMEPSELFEASQNLVTAMTTLYDVYRDYIGHHSPFAT
jgi:hypothetical protein